MRYLRLIAKFIAFLLIFSFGFTDCSNNDAGTDDELFGGVSFSVSGDFESEIIGQADFLLRM
jgi:hypothetical protein